LSPDNSQIAVITINREIGSDGVHEVKWEEVKLYDYETGQQKYMLQRTTSAAETYIAMAFSPDSQLLAIAGTEQTILVWDVTNGSQVHQFSFWGPVDDLAFSPDGQFLAAVSSSEEPKEQGVGVFDLETETLIAQLEGTAATSVAFFEGDSKAIVGASYHSEQQTGSSLFFWDFNTNGISKILSQYGGTRVIALSSEKEILAVVIENTLHLIDLQDLTEIEVEKPEVSVRVLSFDNAGNIWALDFDGMLLQWDTHGKLVRQQQFDNATDFAVISEMNHLLISFPEEIWEVAFQ
jgi:WD40 repeat protein